MQRVQYILHKTTEDACIHLRNSGIRDADNAARSISAICRVAIGFQRNTLRFISVSLSRLRQRVPKFSTCGNEEVYADGFARLGIICIIARDRSLQLRFLRRDLFSGCSEQRKFQFNHSCKFARIIVAIMILPQHLCDTIDD